MKKQADYMVEIGELIATARTRQNMTQSELAKKIGTSQSAINRIEHGKQNASLEIISKISHALRTQIVTVNDGATINMQSSSSNAGGVYLRSSITFNNVIYTYSCSSGKNHAIDSEGTIRLIKGKYTITQGSGKGIQSE